MTDKRKIEAIKNVSNIRRHLLVPSLECTDATFEEPRDVVYQPYVRTKDLLDMSEYCVIAFRSLRKRVSRSYNIVHASGRSSVGRASASQAEGRGFESRCPLQFFPFHPSNFLNSRKVCDIVPSLTQNSQSIRIIRVCDELGVFRL